METINLLKNLLSTPSLSRQEEKTADLLLDFLRAKGLNPFRKGHNIWVRSSAWSDQKPTLLLNSHHDTVQPNAGWTMDPFSPLEQDGKLYGLGSNDAGGALVALLQTFLELHSNPGLPVNLLYAATAEEEISGDGGISSILPEIGPCWAGIVGEPTQMQMAVAEKGLLVIDAVAEGKAGHAAREEGINAIYLALDDIERLKNYQFEKISDALGMVKVSVTQIQAGTQHNVVPAECRFVVDVRTNEHYSNREVFEILQNLTLSKLSARSFRLNSSGIPLHHPLVLSGLAIGLKPFGSPTLSDQALISFPTIKLGPGDSARSHTADEFIYWKEISEAVPTYIDLIVTLKNFIPHP